MKKLGKLEINSRKLLKKEELVTLKGGYEGCDYWCWIYDSDGTLSSGVGCGESAFGTEVDCNHFYNPLGMYCHCI